MHRIISTYSVVVLGCLFVVAGCRDNDNNNNNQNNSPSDNTIYQVQDPSHPSHLQVGDLVSIERVVVTAVDTYAEGEDGKYTGNVWVQESEGGPYSGVVVFTPSILPGGTINDIAVGDLVNVAGEVDEYAYVDDTSGNSQTEIKNASITVLGSGTMVVPESVSVQDLDISNPDSEQWESVLVSVSDVRVTGNASKHAEVFLLGGLVAGSDLYDVYGNAPVDQCYSSVTGVMSYFFDFSLMPRSAADLVEGADSTCATALMGPVENNDVLCDDGDDNDDDGLTDCADPSCYGNPEVTVCQTMGEAGHCDDNTDNDGDGHVDCDDWECTFDPACYETNCTNSIDDDGNGHTDCEDYSCQFQDLCPNTENTNATCADGIDNDSSGHIDCEDFGCTRFAAPNVTVCEGSAKSCADGLDNDGDGHIDCDDYDCRGCNGSLPYAASTCLPCD